MRPQQTKNVLVLTTAAAAAALLLAGCGTGTTRTQSSGPATPTPGAPVQAETPPASTNGVPAPVSSAPAPASEPAAGSGVPACKAGGLTASTEVAGGGAGSVYLELILTNSGTGSCLLQGFAGVSLTAEATGEPIGAPAVRDLSSSAAAVVLAPGQAGTATLRYTQAGNHAGCTRVQAAGLRVYPPEERASLFVADPLEACSNPEINLLTIGAFQAR